MEDGPFDRRLRRLRRDRAFPRFEEANFLHRRAADELLDRLEGVKRTFADAIVLGSDGGYAAQQLRARGLNVVHADAGRLFAAGGVQCDEDRLAFGDAMFDLVLSVGVLDSVNDLPGALTLVRRSLRPDGLFLAALAGAGSLPRLRRAMLAADEAQGTAASAHIHPQIDVRAAGDLLMRAGFTLPVVDIEGVDARYSSLLALIADLRAMGSTNILATRSQIPVTRLGLAAAIADFQGGAEENGGKTAERFEILYLTGWSPAPDQPKPARRGSATRSLADALRPNTR